MALRKATSAGYRAVKAAVNNKLYRSKVNRQVKRGDYFGAGKTISNRAMKNAKKRK